MKNNLFIVLLALLFCTACSKKVEVVGSGATFPQPYYNMTFKNYTESTGINVSYGGIGSGGGIRSLKDQIVDFAGTDVIPSESETEGMEPLLYIPTCRGGVVLSYNLQGVERLNLNAEVITQIYTGEITRWNDSSLVALNPGVNLPDIAITPTYRSDGSGTTYNFSEYMSNHCEAWKSQLGVGKTLNFGTGIAAKGNPSVVGTIANTEGAIGYMGSEYAFAMKVPVAAIQNENGEFVLPETKAIASQTYPIVCQTWIALYKEQNYANRTKEQAVATVQLMKYMLSKETQSLTEVIHYAPISEDDRQQALKLLDEITYDGQKLSL